MIPHFGHPLLKFWLRLWLVLQGTTLTFAATCLVGHVRFNFHLPYSNFHLPLKNCMFYSISFKNKENMVLACESMFSRTSLDGRPRNLNTFSKVNMKYTKRIFPVGQASFYLPHSYNLQILLARGNGASTNVEPCTVLSLFTISMTRAVHRYPLPAPYQKPFPKTPVHTRFNLYLYGYQYFAKLKNPLREYAARNLSEKS